MPMVAAFYLKAEYDSGDLILTNPAEYSITNIPFSTDIERKIETGIKVRTGDLVLFPGYIRHKTGENLSNDDRIVISFNIGYSGKYLSSNSEYPYVDDNCISDIEHLNNKILNLQFIIEDLKRNIRNEN
jgi:ectoine hydroxylase-related dioxygenase (phytanoyl-CoA dioxygenase family)